MIPPLFKAIRRDLLKYFNLSTDSMWAGKDIVVFVGQNGAGKSMVRRMLKMGAKERKIGVYDFSQERRTSGGIETSMIYGDEYNQSTGYISIRTFQQAFKQDLQTDYVFIWDEPEIGLSEESQLGVIQLVREQMEKNKRLLGCVFMTHSRLFVQALLDYPKLAFIDMDGRYKTAKGWANRKPAAADLAQVVEHGHKRFQVLSKMLRKKR